MNLRNTILENKFIKLKSQPISLRRALFCSGIVLFSLGGQAWEIDFSHHPLNAESSVVKTQVQNPNISSNPIEPVELTKIPVASTSDVGPETFVPTPSAQNEIVILNTENGFVPHSIALHAGQTYTLHVINVNEKQKNVSFVMDSFNQFQATYFNELKSFNVTPTTEGNFTYQCPETSFEGHAIVLGNSLKPKIATTVPSSLMAPIPSPVRLREPAMTETVGEAAKGVANAQVTNTPVEVVTRPGVQRVPPSKTVGESVGEPNE